MNSFSGYLGLPNISYVTADDLDIANLGVDTITVNTELKTDNIQPLTNTSSITVGLNTNTGVIDFQQDVDVNADLEANNITTIGQINTDNIQPLLSNSNLVIGNATNTGIIDIRQNVTAPTVGITTANITTSNTTNLNTNNIQANPVSSAVSLYTNGTGTIALGNTSNTNLLTINLSTLLQNDKNLQLTGTGKIITPKLRVSDLTANKLVLTDGNNDFVSSSYIDTDFARLTANNTFSGATNTFNNKILCNNIEGTTGSAISLFSTTTAGITLGSGSSSGLTIKDTTTFNTGKDLLFSSTGRIRVDRIVGSTPLTSDINIGYTDPLYTAIIQLNQKVRVNRISASKMVLTDSNKQLVSSLYTDTDFARLAANNTFTGSNTMNGNLTLGSGATITLNSTGGKVIVNTIEGTSTGSAISLYGTSTSTIDLGNTASTSVIGLNQNTTLSTGKILRTPYLYPTSTIADLYVGNQATNSGTLFIELNTDLHSSRTLKLNNTTASKLLLTNASKQVISSSWNETDLAILSANNTFSGATNTFSNTLVCNTISATSTSSTGSLYGNILGGNVTIGASMRNGTLAIGSTSFNPATDTGYVVCHLPLYVNQDFNLATGKNIITSNTSKVYCNVYTGTSSSSNLSIGEVGDTGSLTIYKTTTFSGGSSTFGTIVSNTINATATNSTCTLFGNVTNGSVSIAGGLTGGNLLLGFAQRNYGIRLGSTSYNSTTDTGYIDLLLPVNALYNITMSTSNKILCNSYQGRTTNSNVSLFTETSGATNTITIGNTGGGNLTINPNVVLPANKTITLNATGGEIKCNSYDCVAAANDVELFGSTTGIAAILPNQTENDLYIGQSNTLSAWQFGNTNPALDSGTLTINKNVAIASVKSIACLNYNSTSATTAMYIANTSTTGAIIIGEVQTSGNILLGNRFGTGECVVNTKFNQIRQVSSIDRTSFFNVAIGSANNIFQSSMIKANAMPPIYAGAQTDGWSVWESDTENEASFIGQNGNTTIICNPGDNYAIHWQDEDAMVTAFGFKFSITGVMSTSSDRRVKRDINPIPVGSDLLDKLSLIEYVNYKRKAPTEEKYYKDGKLRQKYQDIHKGLIAQDVKQIFPDVVEKEGEYFMMKYPEVDIYFNMGVQELIKQNKAQQVEIDDLKARLVRLEQMILNP